jgi:hypothetical protein
VGGVSGERIPPGYYTPETLPPLSEGDRKVLASVDAVAPLVDVRSSANSVSATPGITLEDEGMEGIRLSDEPLPGFSLEDLDRLGAILKGEFERYRRRSKCGC